MVLLALVAVTHLTMYVVRVARATSGRADRPPR